MKRMTHRRIITASERKEILKQYHLTKKDVQLLEYCGEVKAGQIMRSIKEKYPQYDYPYGAIFTETYKDYIKEKTPVRAGA